MNASINKENNLNDNEIEKPFKPQKNVLIGREALIVSAKGQREWATQVFSFNNIREIRLDFEKNEVKVLTTYDEAYYRIFAAGLEDENGRQKAINFYNGLINGTLRLQKEDFEKIKQNRVKHNNKSK